MPLTIDIQENAYLREVWREAEQKGIEKGIARGIEKAIEQGIEKVRQECRETVIAILDQRFGSVPEEARKQLGSASLETLLRWMRRAFTAGTLEEVLD